MSYTEEYLKKKLTDGLNATHVMKCFITNELTWCAFGVLLSVFLRVCTTLHPYSGSSKPPMYGDYEAQRHWMEITVNLPMNEWYNNSTLNDLEYWGLDYPPLTAYHSYVNGLIAYLINPDFVELFTSRGYESDVHKLFMRYTVLIADLCLYIPALIAFFVFTKDKLGDEKDPFIVPVVKSKAGGENAGKNKGGNENESRAAKSGKSKNSAEMAKAKSDLTRGKNETARNKSLNERDAAFRNRNTSETGSELRNRNSNPAKSKNAEKNVPKTADANKDVVTKSKIKIIETPDNFTSLTFPVILGLLYPGLILIDHGHFQYNCVSLGLTVISVTFLFTKREIFSTFFFCLALNYKQMELYHAFPFFFYLLSSCIPKPGEHALTGFLRLLKIATTVLVTFALLWLPFIFNLKTFLQVLHRLFPVARGLFEDKVANVWCSLNVVYKFKSFCAPTMLRYCTLATLTAVLPSSADLFLRPNLRKFVPALINSSLSFFLFSFQVHEKSILLVAVPVVLYLQVEPVACVWFLYVSGFSMLPLFVKDGLTTAYVGLNVTFFSVFLLLVRFNHVNLTFKSDNTFYSFYKQILSAWSNKRSLNEVANIVGKHVSNNRGLLWNLVLCALFLLSFAGSLLLTVLVTVFRPPSRYPDLFTLLVAVYSCVHFVGFFVYFTVAQFRIPQSFDDVHIKLKES